MPKDVSRIIEYLGWSLDGYPNWQCEKSPSGHCQYDTVKDPACDQCIHCGEPHERK